MTSGVFFTSIARKRHPTSFFVLAALSLALTQSPAPESGLDLASFDRSVRPQDDLYRFANGGWLDRTPMPDERVTYTAATEVSEKVEADLRTIIESVVATPNRRPGSAPQQIADLYTSMIDEATIESLGGKPLAPVLARIEAIRTTQDLAREAGVLSATTTGGPFFASIALDPGSPGERVVHLSQGGILLPDRDYYLLDEPRYRDARDKYRAYLETIFTLTGRSDATTAAAAVVALESELARAFWPTVDSRNVNKTNNPIPLRRMPVEMPGFDWLAWARPQGIDRVATIIVLQPSFFREFAAMVPRAPLSSWKAWLAARYITAATPYVSKAFNDARFEFFGRVLTGQETPRPRWRRGVSIVNGNLGDAIGRMYVEKHFPVTSRTRVQRIVEHIVRAYRLAVGESDWLSGPARAEALDKLTRLTSKVGYPDTWRDYHGLDIRPDDLIGNIARGLQFENVYRMARVDRPVNRGEWLMSPQTVNAYYTPGTNEIVFPAAMLQPPYFNARADDAVNYGAIGAVIGHEIGHGLDDRGRHFDGTGAVRDWWRPQDERAYRERIARLVDQFNGYSPVKGLQVNGALTLGENVGDLSGLAVAYRAYRLSLSNRTAPIIDGFTGDQRFFLGWAQIWRTQEREAYLRQISLSTSYAPAQYRANGPVTHLAAFYEAFGVKPGDVLYRAPAERVRIW
jgi:predicted metalloendopeptidase